jgi:hypothetical protein
MPFLHTAHKDAIVKDKKLLADREKPKYVYVLPKPAVKRPPMDLSKLYQLRDTIWHGKDPSSLTPRQDRSDGKWVTADQLVLKVEDMDNSHLYNAIRILARNGRRSYLLEREFESRIAAYESMLPPEERTGKRVVIRNIIRED